MTFYLEEYRKKRAVFVYRNDPLDATDALGEALEEIEDLREKLTLAQKLLDSGPRCQCSDDEACAHVRRAEAAEARAERLLETLKLLYQEISESKEGAGDILDWAQGRVREALAADSATDEQGGVT